MISSLPFLLSDFQASGAKPSGLLVLAVRVILPASHLQPAGTRLGSSDFAGIHSPGLYNSATELSVEEPAEVSFRVSAPAGISPPLSGS
jgi:hypothetical protein